MLSGLLRSVEPKAAWARATQIPANQILVNTEVANFPTNLCNTQSYFLTSGNESVPTCPYIITQLQSEVQPTHKTEGPQKELAMIYLALVSLS